MSDQEIKINLCYYDPENPNSNLDAYEDEDRPQPRNECGCDNCFYGRDKLAMQLIEAKCERDESRIDAQKSKAYKRVLKETNLRQTERIRYLEGATNHSSGTPLSIALKERDEANEELSKKYVEYDQLFDEAEKIRIELEMWRDGNIMHEIHRNDLEKVERERDEARDAILGWENKWKCAVDMAARAEIERDEAINKLKELKDILR